MKNHTLPFCVLCCLLVSVSALCADELVHVLQKGETLYGLSRKYHVPADAIMSLNNISNPDNLRAGQKLRIPGVYTVAKGDTLYGIARKIGVPVDLILSSNGLDRESTIKVGDILIVPATGTAVASTGAAVAAKDPSGDLPPPVIAQKPLEDPRSYENRAVDTSIIWPVTVKDISYLSGKVYGVSITSQKGEKVKAISSGTVLSTGPYRGFGQVVFLQSKTGYIYVYGGLDGITPAAGDSLSFGDEIGTLGADSLSGKPRLYFMVYNKDVPVDPAKAPRGY
jgi:murein DD-endopeptidase MepM/ murein hydrolase activator NlpD